MSGSYHISREYLQQLGFTINRDKKVLVPNTSCQFLGFIFQSINMTLELPITKKQNMIRWCQCLIILQRCKIRDLARFLGLPGCEIWLYVYKVIGKAKSPSPVAKQHELMLPFHSHPTSHHITDLSWGKMISAIVTMTLGEMHMTLKYLPIHYFLESTYGFG
nr:unnamed protein product [Callosobruchus chinensis]